MLLVLWCTWKCWHVKALLAFSTSVSIVVLYSFITCFHCATFHSMGLYTCVWKSRDQVTKETTSGLYKSDLCFQKPPTWTNNGILLSSILFKSNFSCTFYNCQKCTFVVSLLNWLPGQQCNVLIIIWVSWNNSCTGVRRTATWLTHDITIANDIMNFILPGIWRSFWVIIFFPLHFSLSFSCLLSSDVFIIFSSFQAVDYDNLFSNSKYCIQQLLHEDTSSDETLRLLRAKNTKEIWYFALQV